ncbi:peptidoglycan editing factor PgeF [Kordiimonas sp.]|uniref:peptidoglycan editing factor PgeF n=1 Tax=Kordiimonas sp. TaxID=1970157 RepID=UPI003A903E6C
MTNHKTCPHFQSSHAFLSRDDGVSGGIYAGLNCGPGSNDKPEHIAMNRRIAARIISGDSNTPVLSCYQVHGNTVARAMSDWGDERPKADAMVSCTPGLILGILTADCCPVLFEDAKAGVIGAAHAGWQGAIRGVLAETIKSMEAMGATRGNIRAAIGPTIARESYEVGAEFYARFLSEDRNFSAFFGEGRDTDHFQFDLPKFVQHRLESEEIGGIWNAATNTYTSDAHFSYRRTTHRQEPDYGRQLSAIMLRG